MEANTNDVEVDANTHAHAMSLEPHRHSPRIESLAEVLALAPAHPPRHDDHAGGLGLAHVAREGSARLPVGPEEGGVVTDHLVRVRVSVGVGARVRVRVRARARVRVRVRGRV